MPKAPAAHVDGLADSGVECHAAAAACSSGKYKPTSPGCRRWRHRARVSFELRLVALDLRSEKRLEIAALVLPGFEVDDPARAVRDERSIEPDVLETARRRATSARSSERASRGRAAVPIGRASSSIACARAATTLSVAIRSSSLLYSEQLQFRAEQLRWRLHRVRSSSASTPLSAIRLQVRDARRADVNCRRARPRELRPRRADAAPIESIGRGCPTVAERRLATCGARRDEPPPTHGLQRSRTGRDLRRSRARVVLSRGVSSSVPSPARDARAARRLRSRAVLAAADTRDANARARASSQRRAAALVRPSRAAVRRAARSP